MHKEVSEESHSRDAASLREAFGREGCPVCTVVIETMNQAMDTWNYDGFTDVEHRQVLARIRGFCPLHTWQLAQRDNPFQLAVVYKEILMTVLEEMDHENCEDIRGFHVGGSDWISGVKHFLQGGNPPKEDTAHLYALCPFCRTRAECEQRLVERLVELIRSEEMQDRLRQSTGLCQLHYRQCMQYAHEQRPAQCQVLFACQRLCLQRSLREIEEQIRKHDYRFRQEPHGEEMTAWRRAAELFAGNPGVRS